MMENGILIRFRLVGDEAKALHKLSAAEMRSPRDQTRLILRRELERRGLLPADEQNGEARAGGGNGDGD